MAPRTPTADRRSAGHKGLSRLLESVSLVDLFCGAGGLTRGLLDAGLQVIAGIDVDEDCRYPFERNNRAVFINRDVLELRPQEVAALYPRGHRRVLVGCAPCQPFSRYARTREASRDAQWELLRSFARLAKVLRPEVISMENVPELARKRVFQDFARTLRGAGYHVSPPTIVYGPDYGLPQQRTRLLFFASLLGPVVLRPPTHAPEDYVSVRDAIGDLEPLGCGEAAPRDPLHRSSDLSAINLRRIKASKPGGTWRDWPKSLIAECHRRSRGATYPAVYGRMEWDSPSPTITTQFFGYGNGRFGHPQQDRALSLREGAILQSFPNNYEFHAAGTSSSFVTIGRMIGNAVPVLLGRVVGETIRKHLEHHSPKPRTLANGKARNRTQKT